MKLNKLNIGTRFDCNGSKGTLLSFGPHNAWADVQFDGKQKTYISAGAEVKPLDKISKPKFVYNDGGRQAAGFIGNAGDCVARAIAIASGESYKAVYNRLADGMANQRKSKRTPKQPRSARNGIYVKRKWFKDYMSELGFEYVATMGIGTGCQVHLKADELPKGKIICTLSKHYAAVIDGVINDTYDCSRNGTRCVYGYWQRKDMN